MPDSDGVLMVFAKNPQPGKAKTRLEATLGEQQADAIYKGLLRYTLQQADSEQWDLQVWYSGGSQPHPILQQADAACIPQPAGDLGDRMKQAFAHNFSRKEGPVVVIGSDCAQLTAPTIQKAFEALADPEIDMVIGPSKDGGYYLLGLSKPAETLFEKISWSTDTVFEATLMRAQEAGLRYRILSQLNDVDTEEDWKEVADRITPFMNLSYQWPI